MRTICDSFWLINETKQNLFKLSTVFVGCPDTESSMESSINICADADNLMQNYQPVATLKDPQDMTIEGNFIKPTSFVWHGEYC